MKVKNIKKNQSESKALESLTSEEISLVISLHIVIDAMNEQKSNVKKFRE